MKRFCVVPAAAIALVGALTLTGCGGGEAAAHDASVQPPAATTQLVLLPEGLGPLEIGSTEEAARATGMVGALIQDDGDGCRIFEAGPSGNRTGRVRIGPAGVFGIAAPEGVATPKGIAAGATRDEVRIAYPDVQEYRGGLANDEYLFRFLGVDDRMSDLRIEPTSPCGTPS